MPGNDLLSLLASFINAVVLHKQDTNLDCLEAKYRFAAIKAHCSAIREVVSRGVKAMHAPIEI